MKVLNVKYKQFHFTISILGRRPLFLMCEVSEDTCSAECGMNVYEFSQ